MAPRRDGGCAVSSTVAPRTRTGETRPSTRRALGLVHPTGGADAGVAKLALVLRVGSAVLIFSPVDNTLPRLPGPALTCTIASTVRAARLAAGLERSVVRGPRSVAFVTSSSGKSLPVLVAGTGNETSLDDRVLASTCTVAHIGCAGVRVLGAIHAAMFRGPAFRVGRGVAPLTLFLRVDSLPAIGNSVDDAKPRWHFGARSQFAAQADRPSCADAVAHRAFFEVGIGSLRDVRKAGFAGIGRIDGILRDAGGTDEAAIGCNRVDARSRAVAGVLGAANSAAAARISGVPRGVRDS